MRVIASINILLWVFILDCCILSADAQDSGDPGFTPAITARFKPHLTAATISAGTTDTRAEIQTALYSNGFGIAVSAAAPIAKSGSTQLASLDGLSTGTTASLSINNIVWEFGGSEVAKKACMRLLQKGKLRKADGTAVDPDASLNLDGEEVTWAAVCGDSGGTHRFNLLQSDQERRLQSIIEKQDSRPILFEVAGEVGREDASHIDATTFESVSETNTPFSIGASIGTVLPSGTLMGVGIEYKSVYRAGNQAEVCVPVGTNGALQCRSGPLGMPTSREGAMLNAQVRRFLGSRIGVNPQFQYAVSDGDWAINMPIYFAPDEDGGLVGGIVPGYDSETEDWTLQLTVGAAFRLGL